MSHPCLLVADTHAQIFSLGLQNAYGKRFFFQSKTSENLSSALIPCLKSFLNNNNMPLRQIDCFGIVRGPGSLTGIRIGMIVFKTLSFLSHKDCYGLDLLKILTLQSSSEHTVILIQSHRNFVYTQLFDANKNPLNQAQCITVDQALKSVKKNTTVVVSGFTPPQDMTRLIVNKKAILIQDRNPFSSHLNTLMNETLLTKKNKKYKSYQTLTPINLLANQY